jgi:hypothetical protein
MRQEVFDDSGLPTGSFATGFMFVAAELGIEPRSGDVFTETLNGAEVIWKAMCPGKGRKVWEWADTSGVMIMVWTKRVAA